MPPALLNGDKNPVSALNEYGQKRGMEVRIEVVSQSGPPHNPRSVPIELVGNHMLLLIRLLVHKSSILDRHAPQRMNPLRENNLPLLPSHPLPRHLISTFQGSGAGVF